MKPSIVREQLWNIKFFLIRSTIIDGMTSSCCTFEARSQRAARKIIWIALIRISLPTMRTKRASRFVMYVSSGIFGSRLLASFFSSSFSFFLFHRQPRREIIFGNCYSEPLLRFLFLSSDVSITRRCENRVLVARCAPWTVSSFR